MGKTKSGQKRKAKPIIINLYDQDGVDELELFDDYIKKHNQVNKDNTDRSKLGRKILLEFMERENGNTKK